MPLNLNGGVEPLHQFSIKKEKTNPAAFSFPHASLFFPSVIVQRRDPALLNAPCDSVNRDLASPHNPSKHSAQTHGLHERPVQCTSRDSPLSVSLAV